MNRLHATDVATFARKYRFAGGRLRRVKVTYAATENFTIEFVLTARTALKDLGTEARPVKLRFRVTGVEEFRFQKRPSVSAGSVSEARIGYFNGLFYVNLDAWGLAPGDVPRLHDFRASDTYLAGREMQWEEVVPKPAPDSPSA